MDDGPAKVPAAPISDVPPPLESCPDPSKSFIEHDMSIGRPKISSEPDVFDAFVQKLRHDPTLFYALADKLFNSDSNAAKYVWSNINSNYLCN